MNRLELSSQHSVYYTYHPESDKLTVRLEATSAPLQEEPLAELPHVSLSRDQRSGKVVGIIVRSVQQFILENLVRTLVSQVQPYLALEAEVAPDEAAEPAEAVTPQPEAEAAAPAFSEMGEQPEAQVVPEGAPPEQSEEPAEVAPAQAEAQPSPTEASAEAAPEEPGAPAPEAEAPKPKRRSRRKKASEPEEVTAAVEAAVSAIEQTSEAAPTPEIAEAEVAAPKRRTRRKKAAEPEEVTEAVEAAVSAIEEATTEAPAPETGEAEAEAPKPKRRTRRKKAAEPEAMPEAAEAATEEAPPDEAPKPKRRPRRKKAEAAPEAAEVEAPATPVAEAEAPKPKRRARRKKAEEPPTPEPEAEAAGEEAQGAETTAEPEAASEAPAAPTEAEGIDEEAAAPEAEADEAPDEETKPSRSRRSRRRKRKGSAATAEAEASEAVAEPAAPPAEAADVPAAEESKTGRRKRRRRKKRGREATEDVPAEMAPAPARAETKHREKDESGRRGEDDFYGQRRSFKTAPIPGLGAPESFDFMGMDPLLGQAIAAMGFEAPTPIQRRAVPPAMEGEDVIGLAQTGTGKTMAFLIPSLQRLLQSQSKGHRPRLLVLTPTRELAIQVAEEAEYLATHTELRISTIYGGADMKGQIRELKAGTDVIVATPGRLLDHLNRGNVRLDAVEVLVLDEADRMLDMGFLPEIRDIIRRVPSERQTLLFSATMPPAIQSLSLDFQRDPHLIEVARQLPPATIDQRVFPVERHLKVPLLAHLLQQDEGMSSVLVFTETKAESEVVARKLREEGISVALMHGDRSQAERERALQSLRDGSVRVLVATNVAARGLDISDISHVVNYDVPQTVDDYVHRIGRTARGEAEGKAYTFASLGDLGMVARIEAALETALPRERAEGFDYDVPTPSWAKPSAEEIAAELHKPKGLADRFKNMLGRR